MNWIEKFVFLMFVDYTTTNGIFIDSFKWDLDLYFDVYFDIYFHSNSSTVHYINALKQSVNTRDIKEFSKPFKENTMNFLTKITYLTMRGIKLW